MQKWRNRNQDDLFMPIITPKFKIPREAKFFMFGSCFARYLELELHEQGFEVLSIPDKDLPLDTNRYHLPSILQAIDGSVPNTEESFVEIAPGRWGDPYLQTPKGDSHSLEQLLALRDRVDEISRRVFDADVVILTLGLTESWYDSLLDLHACRNLRDEERFFPTNADPYGSYNYLGRIRQRLEAKRLIGTVSPIPLNMTFTEMDAVTANAYSKATLRSVAQSLARTHDNYDYFPSYEMAINSKDPWKEDGRHVKPEIISHIMKQFIEHYIEEEDK